MDGRIKKLAVITVCCLGLGILGASSLIAQASDECAEMKKDIDEMKADLKDYQGAEKLEAEDKADLMQTIADIRKDFNEYLTDSTSDRQEINHARRGMRLAAEMEDGVKNEELKKILSSYAEIIQIYEWFYDDEDCD